MLRKNILGIKYIQGDDELLNNTNEVSKVNEVNKIFAEMREKLQSLHKYAFKNKYKNIIEMYIEGGFTDGQKIKKGISYKNSKKESVDDENGKYEKLTYTYFFWENLKEAIEPFENIEGIDNEEFITFKKTLKQLLEDIGVKVGFLIKKFVVKAFQIGDNVECPELTLDQKKDIVLKVLRDSVTSFDQSKNKDFEKYLKGNIYKKLKQSNKFKGDTLQINKNVKLMQEYGALFNIKEGRYPTVVEIAEHFKTSLENVERWREYAMKNISLDSGKIIDNLSRVYSLEDDVIKKDSENIIRGVVKEMESSFSDAEKVIMKDRLLTDNPVTLQSIADQFALSREGIRKIEVKLLKKIKDFLKYKKNIKNFDDINI